MSDRMTLENVLKAEERFFEKVEIMRTSVREGLSECWEWIGARNHSNNPSAKNFAYGYITIGGRRSHGGAVERAHRVSWVMHFGLIPKGMNVLHKCDNVRCVRPDHLFLGTLCDNARDMVAKGRYNGPARIRRGDDNKGSKMTSRDVMEIRRLRLEGVSPTEIARIVGVTKAMVNNVIYGRSWKHVA